MIRINITFLVVGLGLVAACAPAPKTAAVETAAAPAITGAWRLVSEEITIDGQSHPTFDPASRRMMKIFNDSHFSFVSAGEERPAFTSYNPPDSVKIVAYDNFGGGAGRYTYKGGFLTEHIEYMSVPNYEGVSIRFKITIDGDTMVQEGAYPLRDLGLGEKDGYLYSVFERIR